MIRATRGRSRRPNHMRSQIGRPKAMPPVNFRRLWGDLHSVAKQASFGIALQTDFGGFGRHFGRFGEPKWMPTSTFWTLFCDVFFERVLASIFGRFLKAGNLKIIDFP